MEEEEEKAVDVVEGQELDDKSSVLSSIARPMSHTMPRPPSRPAPSARVRALGKEELDDVDQNSEEEDEEEEDEEDDEDQGIQIEGAYDPADFEHLQVSSEMKELFQYITRYTPQNIDLDTKLRPFIPEFIPAVGDIDAFIKVPRPDNVMDKLGLVVLDEPCAKQSDPTVLDLQLRAISKETTFKSVAVKSLENADKRPKEIDAWINSISNLHRSKPPPTVHYSRNMPDIETLMQEWPPEFEEALNQFGIPSAELDCSLEEYVELICGIMDIPVYRSKIQSLHVLFTLFLEFRNSQHFRSLAMNNEFGDGQTNESHSNGADHLVIRN
ncbi:intraflagellar transport protein 46 homolog isoform X2 [Argiope bruennichi]|uniref:Intraflagellar transport protein 46 homolog n=1 Tax=Argiope bruennichi TaxID=94029 RepID=A0A8T0EGX0_ARGBR|nr:intraflagellar transport protein 46 homolog isoform X2 [Argiope bruennichi]KAF8773092.1 Intraflagellar transport protein 46 like protein [Argiope bruennichi]